MDYVFLDAGPLHAAISPALGGAVHDFSYEYEPGETFAIYRRAQYGASAWPQAASIMLTPWSNRVAGASLRWRGETHGLVANQGDGTANHGELIDRPMRVIDRTPVSIRLAFDSADHPEIAFPWRFGSTVRYELSPETLDAEVSITNLGDRAMPAGGGFHPWFPRHLLDGADDPIVTCPVAGRYPAEGCLPTGPAEDDELCRRLTGGVALSELDQLASLDDVFTAGAGDVTIRWPASGVTVRMQNSDNLGHRVIFTPVDARRGKAKLYFCVEPVSMVNDGFNLAERGWEGTGTRVLEPGESMTMRSVTTVLLD